MPTWDVAVVGSGPSGALAAAKLVEGGARVLLLDVAHDDAHYRSLIPDQPFSELRRLDPGQRRYFLGDRLEGVTSDDVRVGAQLTPPRQFVTAGTERWLPCRGEGFDPMQSLALGGLGAAWGAASFTYTPDERREAGIDEPGFERHYDEVSRTIGISGDPGDDASRHCFRGVSEFLPALELDTLSESIWRRYLAKREDLLAGGVSIGRTPLAILSRDFGSRRANPYFDMDFWSESRRSVFRPRYLVEELEKEAAFELARDHLVVSWASDGTGVDVHCRNVRTDERVTHRVRRLLLCAGAIGSARIALRSLGLENVPVPMLCNPYRYFPCLNVRMLGRRTSDRRHSMSQLTAIYAPKDDPADVVSAQFYGYRSLLLFKLVKEIPLPPWAGLLAARLVVNALTIIGLHHSDAPHAGKTLRILPGAEGTPPEVQFDYVATTPETKRRNARERALLRLLRPLGILPYGRIDPGAASSIHYAGTLPIREEPGEAFTTRPDGRFWAEPRVWVGDGASWRVLPAKGLTFTLMANARRVSEHLLDDLGPTA